MAIFKVEKLNISDIWEHSNADKLALAKVEGIDLQFVIAKDSYNIGDEVIYFPIDSLLPEDLIDHLGLTGKLAGKKQNRIKTVKLRGEISQGFVCPLSVVMEYIKEEIKDDLDFTETLGVVKYEPPEVPCHNGNLVPLADGVSVFDIEGVERFADATEILMDTPCIITEKIEGTNWGLTINPDDEVIVNQRNYSINEKDGMEHMFWKVARRGGFIELAKDIKSKMGASQVTLRGEMIGPGIQKNYYNLKEHKVLLFAVQIDYKYWDMNDVFARIDDDLLVPILGWNITLRDWLNGKSIADASTGQSKLISDKLREGIVITPMEEMSTDVLGRLILKKRSPEYLEKTGN
jgi:RNA ligase (TIGR02306 family)